MLLSFAGAWIPYSEAYYYSLRWSCPPNFIEIGQAVSLQVREKILWTNAGTQIARSGQNY